ncbi:phosphatase PAP2 family protein [Shewanella intestini]|uniref:Phosphatase PAP2 family protein n=1 Tax=Shewanella intestini TaxID=2017544 RepID=A0ABS5I6X2_9GAMM|nr:MULTISPECIES: phosphatase PAP2 family protein [Shewanella]MBR9729479.1 phosphatase PAP2 family protein [Shewanella intestini]MRG35060.1 phosphatase PAP2 family protein [Shewanella sp. XMDDZSB0408]
MNNWITPSAQPLAFHRRYVLGYLLASLLVILSVQYADTRIATFMHTYNSANLLFHTLSEIPLVLSIIAASLIVLGMLPKWRPTLHQVSRQLTWLFIIATTIRVSSKVIFGRTWPETWINHNLSWIDNGIEGFYPFNLEAGFHSFPSGHTLFAFALGGMFCHLMPRLRVFWLVLMFATACGQLGQNYHYLGDILAGATMGLLLAHCCTHISKV